MCGIQGHLRAVCNQNPKVKKRNDSAFKGKRNDYYSLEGQNYVVETSEILRDFDQINHVSESERGRDKPLTVELDLYGTTPIFEIDTGSPISAISSKYFGELRVLSRLNLQSTTRQFSGYSGFVIKPLGVLMVDVKFKTLKKKLELFVMPGASVPIVGRPWLFELGIIKVSVNNEIMIKKLTCEKDVKSRFPEVFSGKLGTYTKGEFKLRLKEGAKAVFAKARPVPYALRDKIERELDRLQKDGVIERVNTSEWATPIVPVLKSNGEVRICGDFKSTVNPLLVLYRHPIPRVNDLLVKMSRAKVFTKLDLTHAYQQVRTDEKSRELLTINTLKGLFRYLTLASGITPASELFQELIEKTLVGIENAVAFYDDTCVFGKDQESHDAALNLVLTRFKDCGLTVNVDKCQISKPSIEFLGYVIDKEGLHAPPSKIEAIQKLKPPENLKELRAFLGLINYYARFIENFSSIVNPFHVLLRKDVPWVWDSNCERAFNECKRRLASKEVLVHYRSDLPLKVVCDASPFGLGSFLAHIFPGNKERPVAFASRALTKADRNYSQLDREALALVFAVKTFHQYVYGRHFILETDHKPLTFIFGSKKGLPQMTAARIQRWAVFLSALDFENRHIKGTSNIVADSLSRAVKITKSMLNSMEENEDVCTHLNFITETINCVDVETVRNETLYDPILKNIYRYVQHGWPNVLSDDMLIFKRKQEEIYIDKGCLMGGTG